MPNSGFLVNLGYDNGALTLQEWWARGNGALGPAKNAQGFVRGIEDSFATSWVWSSVGFVATLLIMGARARFRGFLSIP